VNDWLKQSNVIVPYAGINNQIMRYMINLGEMDLTKDYCDNCYGYPCTCDEENTYKPVWTVFMWVDKENQMIRLNDIPLHPRTKRMWDQAVPLR
jgi:hypothetical protein